MWHQTALCSLFWHMHHHVKRCCKESLWYIIHLMPWTRLTDRWHHWQPFERNLHPAERFGSVITVLNLSLVFKSKNDTLSNLPVGVIAEVMNALWRSLARKHYFPSSENTLKKRNVLFSMSCIIHAKTPNTPPPLLPFNSSCILLPFEHCKMKAFCIERTGGCETSLRIWIVALRAGGKKNIKCKNHSDSRRSRDLSRY